ncbi:hypothetical protein like AT1G72100 [Hibiscus trionum]|uniref:TMEM205-like domain-containing protein n=1 Tax=Hibiscus trionum TaxID=183268 RepID=A0A9W7I9T0_HIBTR|nr:hypothetical protein like AT1G72100 [Hibiscus trionum]
MMNILGLSLVVTSLAAAGIWSPTPQTQYVGAGDGHRVIVVEYDEDDQRGTKTYISPQLKLENYFSKEGLKEAASVLPNLGQGISPGGKAGPGTGTHIPGELICDAFGKCTQTFASVFDKAKDKVSETADEAKHKVGEIASKAKGAVAQKGQVLKESANECIDKAKDAVGTVKETAEAARCHLVNNSTEKAGKAREISSANKLFLNRVMGIAHLVGLASAYGMSVWVTFISSTVLGEALPRQQFGVVQSKIYPVYFKAMGFSVGLALLGHLLGQRTTLLSSKTAMFQAFNLLCSFLLVLVNALYFGPKATKVMLERMRVEKEERRGRDGVVAEETAMKSRESPSSAATIGRLKKLNAKSSLVNVVTLAALTLHLLYLAHRISSNRC